MGTKQYASSPYKTDVSTSTESESTESSTVAIIIIVVILVLVILLAITITILILKDRKKADKPAQDENQDYNKAADTERAQTTGDRRGTATYTEEVVVQE